MRVWAIVLAAGEGKRAGGVKALLKLGGRTFLEAVVTAVHEAGCEPVIVVGGAEGSRVEAEASRLGAGFVLNEHWRSGQFSSLKAGAMKAREVEAAKAVALAVASAQSPGPANARTVAAASANAPRPAALVALVDHPWVRPETYRTLLEAFRESPGRIVIAVCEDRQTRRVRRGHPVVIPTDILTEVIAAPDGTTLRDIIRGHADLVLEVRVDDPGVLKNINTAADLRDVEGPGSCNGETVH